MMKTKIVSDATKLYLENLMRRGTLGDAGTNGMIDIKIYLKKFIVIDWTCWGQGLEAGFCGVMIVEVLMHSSLIITVTINCYKKFTYHKVRYFFP